jgi:hypothetical protein
MDFCIEMSLPLYDYRCPWRACLVQRTTPPVLRHGQLIRSVVDRAAPE